MQYGRFCFTDGDDARPHERSSARPSAGLPELPPFRSFAGMLWRAALVSLGAVVVMSFTFLTEGRIFAASAISPSGNATQGNRLVSKVISGEITTTTQAKLQTSTTRPATTTTSKVPKSTSTSSSSTSTSSTTQPTTTTTRPLPKPTTTTTQPKPRDTGVIGNDVWTQLARCESGNRNLSSGPYYGYFQFSQQTWTALGGSGKPSDHTYEEQRAMAMKLQARSGWGQWPACSRKIGVA